MTTAVHPSSPGHAAFVLCELEWMRARLIAWLQCDRLATFVRDTDAGTASLAEHELRHVIAKVDEVEELLISGGFGLSGLPLRDVRASAEEIAEAAADALADGIADEARALHAAGWIAPARGMRALAENLRNDDAHHFWSITPADFLAAFRDADPFAARSVVQDSDVADAPFTELDPNQTLALAGQLERAARGIDARG